MPKKSIKKIGKTSIQATKIQRPEAKKKNIKAGEKLFTCLHPSCGQTRKTEQAIQKHAQTHELQICQFESCGKQFSDKWTLERHQRQHILDKNFICNQCSRTYGTIEGLKQHERFVHKEPTYMCKFPDCTKKFATMQRRRDHETVHSTIRNFICEFSECHAKFKSKKALTIHQRLHAITTKEHKCEFQGCSSSFKVLKSLKDHQKVHKQGPNQFHCDYLNCGKSYNTKKDLLRHSISHDESRPFKCAFKDCAASFKLASVLKTHQRIHTGEKPFLCDFPNCAKQFCQLTGLIAHKRIHSGIRDYHCQDCKATFFVKKELNRHQLRRHLKSRQKIFICTRDGCTKKYLDNDSLARHMKVQHSDGKRFCCSICQAKFGYNFALNNHVQKQHLGKCSACLQSGQSEEVAPWIHYKFADERLCLPCAQHKYGSEIAFRTEYWLAYHMQKVFESHPNVVAIYLNKQDPSDDKCSLFRPDIRILTNLGILIILELDEHAHVGYMCKIKDMLSKWNEIQLGKKSGKQRHQVKEDGRISQIITTGDIEKTIVFRLNPDRYVADNGQTLESNQIIDEDGNIMTVDVDEARAWRFSKIESDVRACLDNPYQTHHFIHVVYWFYDGPMRREGFIPVDGDEYRSWVTTVQALAQN